MCLIYENIKIDQYILYEIVYEHILYIYICITMRNQTNMFIKYTYIKHYALYMITIKYLL